MPLEPCTLGAVIYSLRKRMKVTGRFCARTDHCRVTNIDREHLDHYGTMEKLNDSFLEFVNKVPFYGLAVLCSDDERLRNLLPRVVKRYQTYGLHEHPAMFPTFAPPISACGNGV